MWLDINSFIYSTNAGVSMSEECQIHLVETIIENSRRLNYSGVEIAYIPNTTSEVKKCISVLLLILSRNTFFPVFFVKK